MVLGHRHLMDGSFWVVVLLFVGFAAGHIVVRSLSHIGAMPPLKKSLSEDSSDVGF